MTPRPRGDLEALRLLVALAIRRRLHRWSMRRRRAKAGRRTPTPRKGAGVSIGLVLFSLLMLFQSFMLSHHLVGRYVRAVEWSGRVEESAVPDEDLPPAIREMKRAAYGGPSWPSPHREGRLLAAFSGLLLVVFLGLFCLHLSTANKDLGRADWDVAWLFTLPVGARGLTLAKMAEYLVTDVPVWFVFFPFLTMVAWAAGLGWPGVASALLATACLATMMAALRLVTETWLRKRVGLSRRKNLQALAFVLGALLLLAASSVAFRIGTAETVLAMTAVLPEGVVWTPPTSVLFVARAPFGLLVPLAWTALLVALALGLCTRLLADGLLVADGAAYRGGARGRARQGPRRVLGGLLAKDLRLLLRDRNLMVQMLVVPLLIVGFQLVANPGLGSARGTAGGAAVLAYGIGAYVLMFGAFSVLQVEKDGLWLLYTFPQRLERLIRRKTILWAGVASLYTLGVLAYAWRLGPSPTVADVLAPAFALAGVWTLAHLAAGIGALGTDPFATEQRRRVRPQWVYLYLLLTSIYGAALGFSRPWSAFVLLVLLGMLAWAVWQKVGERLPLLLDPVSSPPRRLGLPDGLVALFAFFVVQQVIVIALLGQMRLGPLLLVAFSASGVVVLTGAVIFLRRVPRLLAGLGLGVRPGARGLAAGAALGVLAAGLAWVWRQAVLEVDVLRRLSDATPVLLGGRSGDVLPLVLLAVVAAPLVEEILFRGLLHTGLRRSTGPRRAVVLGAVLFAVVHPPLAFPAVLGLGLVAGTLRERTGAVWAAMLAHAVYNALVVLVVA